VNGRKKLRRDYTIIENDVMDQERASVIHIQEEISNAAVDENGLAWSGG
jgi:hypothetical protein